MTPLFTMSNNAFVLSLLAIGVLSIIVRLFCD
jgi:hypothetical protein